ncbi:hypothetical protein WMY93_010476 [Mugilogobius chulae]|uniref:Uncharacterized protein n=1 Tax=Mugilogobius chulae TaxID=88201 RepID=A0AAW0P7A4_9GOBI
MTQGYRLQFLRRPPLTGSPTYTVKAIREVKCDQRTGFYSRYFLIPKKDGGLRPILDLRSLNKFLRPLKCKMLTVPRVRQAVLPGDWQDLRVLCPALRDIACPTHLHSVHGCSSWPSKARGTAYPQLSGRLADLCPFPEAVQRECFSIATTPSVLRPPPKQQEELSRAISDCGVSGYVTECQHRNTVFNSEETSHHQRLLVPLSPGARVPWKLCLRLLGLMAATVHIVPLALLHMRPVQRYFRRLGLCPQKDHRTMVLVTRQLRSTLLWWEVPDNLAQGNALGPVLRRQVLSSAASLVGWGAVHEGRGVQGRWTGRWLGQHINLLELQAVFLALQHFLPVLRGRHVLVRTDSSVAAAYVNRQGGLGSLRLCKLAHLVWEWAYPQFLSLRAMHVPGTSNLAADCLSRGGPLPGEWRLNPEIVSQIWARFGVAVIDLFASRENTHCRLFFSILRDNPPWVWTQWRTKDTSGGSGCDSGGPQLAPDDLVLCNRTSPARPAVGAATSQRSLDSGSGNASPPIPSRAQTLGLAPERTQFLAMGLPQSVVNTLEGARAPSTRAAYSYRWGVFPIMVQSQRNMMLCPAQPRSFSGFFKKH